VSVALVAGAIWAALGERGWPSPPIVLRSYSPILRWLHWYGAEPFRTRALAALLGICSIVVVLGCVLLSFKVHLEEIAVLLLGIPFYLSIACSCFLVAGLGSSLIRLLAG